MLPRAVDGRDVDIAPMLADFGFAPRTAFLSELGHRLRRKVLPGTPETTDLAELFGLLLPFYSKFGQGLGPLPAITAVFLYSLLPIMRNTYLALTGVEPGIREAARGIGMTFGQRLRMVELPIAVPVILAGVRTAVVMNIGVMTIAATIGAGGLGVLILTAISRSDMSMLIVGALLVSLLAIFADLLLQWLQRTLTPKGLLK